MVLNSGSISSPSYCWTREVKSERLNLLWPCVQPLEKLCGKQKSSLYERGHFLLLFYWDGSPQPRTWKTLKSTWLSQTLRVSFFIFIFMNQLHFQRVWGGTAAHKEVWRWHFGYPGTTVACKSSQFYVCGENIKFNEVMVSNVTKDISLLAWNSDMHPSKAFAWGLPKLTLSSFAPQSCLIPGFSAFTLSPRVRPAEGVIAPLVSLYQQRCDSTGSCLVAKYICNICMESVCSLPQGLYLSSWRGVFSWFRAASSWRLPWEFLFCLSSDWFQVLHVIISPLLPCLPGTVTSECLSLYFRPIVLVFFGPEPAASALLAGTASQGLAGSWGLSWESSPCSLNPNEMLCLLLPPSLFWRIPQNNNVLLKLQLKPGCHKWDSSTYFWSY